MRDKVTRQYPQTTPLKRKESRSRLSLSLSLSVRVRACIRACVRHERNHCDLDMTGRKDCELHTADTTYFDLDMNDITVT